MDLTELHCDARSSFRALTVGKEELTLVLFHGLDVRNYDEHSRRAYVMTLATEMHFFQKSHGKKRFVLLGDFNISPFDPCMNEANGLNAMMTRACVEREKRVVLSREYEFFYNPMWGLFGDSAAGPAGTVYNTKGQGQYGWSMFDQVIVHHSVTKMFQGVSIIDNTGKRTLANSQGRPDTEEASDHFPILFTIQD